MKCSKYKMKTHTGAAKRFKVTSTGKIMFRGAGVRHLLSKKSSAHKRRKGRFFCLKSGESDFFKRLFPYAW